VPIVLDEPLPGYDRFYTSDPFGNRIEILSPRPVIYSHVAGTALESPL
jgi:hypothetical protein